MNRSQVRELAFKFLYGAEIQKEICADQIETFLEENEIDDANAREYLNDVIPGIIEKHEILKSVISENLKSDWQIERISKVNLALLKLAVYEIQYKKLPYKAIINEVVELAKKYGDETSSQFINGVLASVVRKMQEGENQ